MPGVQATPDSPVSEVICIQALTTGYVYLPRRRIHAGFWFRLLRTLLDKLNTPLSPRGSHGRMVSNAWKQSGHAPRAGQSPWRPYEILSSTVQLQRLEAAATSLHLIEERVLRPAGQQADLFLTEPMSEFTNGLAPTPQTNMPMNYGQEYIKAIDKAIIEARHDSETARALFQLASYGRNDAASLEALREILVKVEIPREFLSYF